MIQIRGKVNSIEEKLITNKTEVNYYLKKIIKMYKHIFLYNY